MTKFGFQLNKMAFRDVLCLRNGWTSERLPLPCPCGEVFSIAHAFSCSKGVLPSITYNRVRDITAQLLTEVCPNVGIEHTLQPLSGKSFPLRSNSVILFPQSFNKLVPAHKVHTYRSANVKEGARLNIKAQNFWDNSKRSAYFDVRVLNTHAPTNNNSSTKACYRRHKREKKREYERRILEVEHGTCTPLVLSTCVTIQSTSSTERPGWGTEFPPAC